MNFITRKSWNLPQRAITETDVYENRRLHRRRFLKSIGLAAGITAVDAITGCSRPTEAEVEKAGAVGPLPPGQADVYPAKRNASFEYGRPETQKREAAEFTNFYEFSGGKDNWHRVGAFKPRPWTIEIAGLCSKPRTFDIDEIHKAIPFEERAYRHRCVETWAMCVPWTGFPLHRLLKLVEPQPTAQYVVLQSFVRPDEAPAIKYNRGLPWPYTEGLTIDEAINELTLVATGIYGQPMPKQHGAPLRLVVPWKYGFKSVKSITKITLTKSQPATFWNTLQPDEYGFQANVDPGVPHPRWSQQREWMLGTRKRYDTQKYNGYGDYVAALYPG